MSNPTFNVTLQSPILGYATNPLNLPFVELLSCRLIAGNHSLYMDYYFFKAFSDDSCKDLVTELLYPVPELEMKRGETYTLLNPTDTVFIVPNHSHKPLKYGILKTLFIAVLLASIW